MSIVSILVFVSQAARRLANKAKNKAITAISNRIKKVEEEQVKVEEHRSKLMHVCHQAHYKAREERRAKFEADMDKLKEAYANDVAKQCVRFEENRRTIALTHQAASNQLKSELVALRSELDHLTK